MKSMAYGPARGGRVSQAVPSPDRRSHGSDTDARVQLDRILASSDFDATDRERRFLSHVVDEALSGRADRIKAYSIAVEVFGRDASFDPQTDPIVRIEASHLRRALERYYLTSGAADPLLITIPKGGYVPTFTPRPQTAGHSGAAALPAAPASVPAGRRYDVRLVSAAAVLLLVAMAGAYSWWGTGQTPRMPERPRLLVMPFDDLSVTETSAAIARGLTQEIVGQLSKFRDIVVIEAADGRPRQIAPPPRFTLAGSVNLSPETFRLRVRLINQADSSILWADTYDGGMNVTEVVGAQSAIARDVATTLAQTYGVIFQADASRHVDNPPDDWAAYSCALSYYAYRALVDLNALDGVRACLEDAVARFPDYATGWGLLSQAYMDGMRFRYPYDGRSSQETIDRALAAAKRAIELDPLNIRGLQSEMFALYFNGDIDGALAVGKHAMAINPNDTELMGEYGYRLALSGNWAEGCPLVSEAMHRNPGPMDYYETAMALCAYFAGDYAQAATLIRRTVIGHNPNYHAIAAAVFAEGGYMEEAARERDWLETNVPGLIENARQEVTLRFRSEEDAATFLSSLKKAGLKIAD